MTENHTEGPWEDHGSLIIGPEGTVCVMPGSVSGLVGGDSNKANGSLIAAAPDLLVALTRAERKLSAYVGVCTGDTELVNTVLPMVRAAIAIGQGRWRP